MIDRNATIAIATATATATRTGKLKSHFVLYPVSVRTCHKYETSSYSIQAKARIIRTVTTTLPTVLYMLQLELELNTPIHSTLFQPGTPLWSHPITTIELVAAQNTVTSSCTGSTLFNPGKVGLIEGGQRLLVLVPLYTRAVQCIT